MSDYISAVAAYKKILNTNKHIKPSAFKLNIPKPQSVLRVGDDIQIGRPDSSVAAQKANNADFASVLKSAFVDMPAVSIKSSAKQLFNLTNDGPGKRAINVIETMKNVDQLSLTVSSVVAIRDKIVAAYMDIMRMPI